MKNLSSSADSRTLTKAEKRLALFAVIFGLPVFADETSVRGRRSSSASRGGASRWR